MAKSHKRRAPVAPDSYLIESGSGGAGAVMTMLGLTALETVAGSGW
jgi:hypothetical protein